MEDKILQACKIITKLGNTYTLLEWHKACVEIMTLGLTQATLEQYIGDFRGSSMGELVNGNYYAAAGYIYNFICWDFENILYVKDAVNLLETFVKVAK